MCGCDRPLELADGSCLKCGRETRSRAEYERVGTEALGLAEQWAAMFEEITHAPRPCVNGAARGPAPAR